MRRIETLYLSGPDPWFPDAEALWQRKQALCAAAGFVAVSSREAPLVETEVSEAMAREIYASALSRLRSADAVIVNLTPWRSPSADPGAAFEVGFAAALGKPVLAYMNLESEHEADYCDRVEAHMGATLEPDGRWLDGAGGEIEDFSLPEALMLWAEARRFYVVVTEDPWSDLTGLELCLDAVKLYSD